MAIEPMPPTSMTEAVEDVEVSGPRMGSSALNSVLQGINPQDVGGLYERRGTGLDDRMNAALSIQEVISDVGSIASRHGLTQQQHFDMLTSLGGNAPMAQMQQNVEQAIPTEPQGAEVESVDDYAAFGSPEGDTDIMESRTMAAQRLRDKEIA
jgi:hypothetical protein|tara:strand:+ start:344 stop:802 length:459 start_codon:yes stop_codon:yes gene_type:complete